MPEENQIVPTPKVEVEETKEAEMGIEPKVEENQIAGQDGLIAYEKETGKQAMVDGKLTDDFKAWALKHSEKLEDVLEEDKKLDEAKKIEEKKLADEKAKEDKLKEKEKTGVYVVENNRNQFVREYTPEIHGDKRKALAEQFAKKIKGKVVIR